MENVNKYLPLVRENIRKLKPYSSARHEFSGEARVHLDANENPFDYHGYNRYPDPMQTTLKKKISALKGTPEDTIFLGNGSDEAIDLLIRIFCTPGEHSIHVPEPTYGMYRVSADIHHVGVNTTLLTEDFQIDEEKLLENLRPEDHILWLCSPNNPSGNSLRPKAILRILDRFGGIVAVDEAYIDFSSEASMISLLREYPNLVVLQTFSKAWGMAGMRIGMAFAQPWIIDLMNKVKSPYNINTYTQEYAIERLSEIEGMRKEVSLILQERQRVFEFLESVDKVEKVFPSDANFILFRVENSQKLFENLRENGVVIRNRNTQPLCRDCLRVSIGTKEENDLFIKYMKLFTK